MAEVSSYHRVLERAGRAIVGGEWAAGHVETVDALVRSTGVSRSIVREVTRELVAAGLLAASPKVGLRARPRSEWDLLNLRVVRWRLQVGDREAQLRELRELRSAVEPEAAALAARAATSAAVAALLAAAENLQRASGTGEVVAFLEADQQFHRALVVASGNEMFGGLAALVSTALEDRALVQRHGLPASSSDVRLHREVAAAVGSGDIERARNRMRLIVERTGTWSGADLPE